MKNILNKMHERATLLNERNIIELMEKKPNSLLLDLGCDDGQWTIKLAEAIGTKKIFGVEILEDSIRKARNKGIDVFAGDLNLKLPYQDNYFDIIHSNQVIEHIACLDDFVAEIYRVLRPGGYAIISTENGSSWHNILASILGWQTFSSAIMSTRAIGVGNPLSINRSVFREGTPSYLKAWTHKIIFNYRGLKEFFNVHGFKNGIIKGAGYYPLPAKFGKIDPRHAHFITIKAYK